MPAVNLGFGKSSVNFVFDANRFDVLGEKKSEKVLTDAEIGAILDEPIDSKTVEETVQPGETVLIVVPDATRQTATGQIVNLLVRRLIANGTMPFDIRIIFANGIHRAVSEAEKQKILTPFINQRIKTINHNARDLAAIVKLGETESGIPIELNRAVIEHDRVITIGGVQFHYFAGFSGGRKMICPGLASSRTVSETHKRAFDFENKTRRKGVGTALLKGNAVHEAFIEVARKTPPDFSINTIANEQDEAVNVFCGDWLLAHEKACEFYAAQHTIEIEEKRDLVIVSCGGFPHDINMIQAHKALETASHACREGGDIIFLAECADGLGRNDFLNWFEAENSKKLAGNLCEKYQVNGQTAWSLLRKAEKFNVQIVTSLSEEQTGKMRLRKAASLDEALSKIEHRGKGYILPLGAKFLIK